MDSVSGKLWEIKFECAIVLLSCANHIQASDVYVNKPIKEHMTQKYGEWVANVKHEFTDDGNMKPVSRRTVVQWIIEVWKETKCEMVADSFKGGAVTTK